MTKRTPKGGEVTPRPLRKTRGGVDVGPADAGARRPRRASSALPELRSTLPTMKGILPWERELLLPIAVEALTDFVETNEHETPDIDKKDR